MAQGSHPFTCFAIHVPYNNNTYPTQTHNNILGEAFNAKKSIWQIECGLIYDGCCCNAKCVHLFISRFSDLFTLRKKSGTNSQQESHCVRVWKFFGVSFCEPKSSPVRLENVLKWCWNIRTLFATRCCVLVIRARTSVCKRSGLDGMLNANSNSKFG